MTTRFFADRPYVTSVIEWTGDNLADVRAAFQVPYIDTYGWTVVQSGSLLHITIDSANAYVVDVGGFAVIGGGIVAPGDVASFLGSRQELDSSRVNYTITDVTP